MKQDLTNSNWTFCHFSNDKGKDEYFANVDIDIIRGYGSKTQAVYTLMIAVKKIRKGEKGVDNNGSRACGWRRPLGDVKVNASRLVSIDDILQTPFGNFEMEWTDYRKDNIKVTEVKS